MLDGISKERIMNLTGREKRWLDNVKKAVLASDRAYLNGEKRDRCFPELCNAIDTAKTLQRSLLDQDTSPVKNKARFLEFFGGVSPDEGGYQSREVVDARNGREIRLTIGELVYAIRCMCHENENLDAEDQPDYHVLLNWTGPFFHRQHFVSQFDNERIEVNAELLLEHTRERITRFVTSIDSYIAFVESGRINISCRPPLGSIRPGENYVYANQE